MYDNPLRKNGVFVVSDFDTEKILKYIKECRGSQGFGFNSKSGISSRFYKEDYTRATPFPLDSLKRVVKFEVPEATVTMDQLLSANGMIREEKVFRVLESMMPAVTQKKDLRYLDYYDEEDRVSELPLQKTSMESFLEDIAYFAKDLEKTYVDKIRDCCVEIYESAAVVTLLRKFRDTCKIEDETKSAKLEDFFLDECDAKDVANTSGKASFYRKYLKKMLEEDLSWLDE